MVVVGIGYVAVSVYVCVRMSSFVNLYVSVLSVVLSVGYNEIAIHYLNSIVPNTWYSTYQLEELYRSPPFAALNVKWLLYC